MSRNWMVLFLIVCVPLTRVSSTSASPAAKVINSAASNVVSTLVKWLRSLQSTPKTEFSSPSMMKFEGGYTIETVLEGSKLGMEPYSIEVSHDGELLVLDSDNSNIYKTSIPLSGRVTLGRIRSSGTLFYMILRLAADSRPKLVAGSPEGYSGHVDGRTREARLNHPKGLAVDDRGNIYIADAVNMAIRKISDSGISTIAGGKWGRGGGHLDGTSEDAKFSNDFDVFYIGITCSLLVVDRGNKAIREIQLHDEDCSHEDGGSFHLGVAVLVAAGFFGYMLALMQQRVQAIFSWKIDLKPSMVRKAPSTIAPYQMPPPKSVRSPLIPHERDNKAEESYDGFFCSAAKLIVNTGSSMAEIIVGLLTIFSRRKTTHRLAYPMQETFMIPEDSPPLELQGRVKRSYPFTTYKEVERSQNFSEQIHPSNYYHHEQHQQQPVAHQRQHHQQRNIWSDTGAYYEKSCQTNDVVFRDVQEQDMLREAMVIKAVDYGGPRCNHHSIMSQINCTGHSNRYR